MKTDVGKDLLNKALIAQEIARIKKRHYIGLQSFHSAKESVSRVKTQHREWAKIL